MIQHALEFVLSLMIALLGLVFAVVAALDGMLVLGMTAIGLPPSVQIALLIVFALVLIGVLLRAVGGVFAVLLIVLLLLMILHRLAPDWQPQDHLPQWQGSGQNAL